MKGNTKGSSSVLSSRPLRTTIHGPYKDRSDYRCLNEGLLIPALKGLLLAVLKYRTAIISPLRAGISSPEVKD